jgi:hypothetical protein
MKMRSFKDKPSLLPSILTSVRENEKMPLLRCAVAEKKSGVGSFTEKSQKHTCLRGTIFVSDINLKPSSESASINLLDEDDSSSLGS